jgi:hypothetical protein
VSAGHDVRRQCNLQLGHEGKHAYATFDPLVLSGERPRCAHRESVYLGHAVQNGRLRYLSVSQLERADPRSGGCLRKWAYRYVFGIKDAEVETESQKKSKDAGTALHAEIEMYLKTGVKALSSLALAGLHMLPEPGPDLAIEFEDNRIDASAPLKAAGIPVIVKMDCVHRRGVNKGGSDVEQVYDPPGTIEVNDWKRKGRAADKDGVSFMLHQNELVESIQMAGYGTYLGNVVPDANYERLSHGYFVDSPRQGVKVTKLVVVDDCRRTWEYVDGVARRMVHAAAETMADSIDANIHACGRYGGCGHRKYCTAFKANATSSLFDDGPQGDPMSLLESINRPAGQPAAAPTVQYGAPQAPYQAPPMAAPPPIAAPVPAAPPPAIAAPQVSLGLLEQQEAEARVRQMAQPIPGFQEAIQYLQIQAGRGLPPLHGRAAMMVAVLGGQAPHPNQQWAGVGDLGRLPSFDSPEAMIELAKEVSAAAQTAQQPAPAPVPAPPPPVHVAHVQAPAAVLPPEAPASNPAIASRPVETAAPAQSGPPPMPAPAAPPKKERKPRPPKAAPAAGAEGVTASAPAELEVFVDCLPNREFDTLTDYMDAMLRALEGKFCVSGIADVRCAPKDGPLGFGGWRGAIHAYVRTNPPHPGTYMLDTRGTDIAYEVADALRSICEAVDGLYVRGIR